MEALGRLKLQIWPFAGPAYLREAGDFHLVSNWAYLGTARSQEGLHDLLDAPEPRFDRDCYRILRSQLRRLVPLPPRSATRDSDDAAMSARRKSRDSTLNDTATGQRPVPPGRFVARRPAARDRQAWPPDHPPTRAAAGCR